MTGGNDAYPAQGYEKYLQKDEQTVMDNFFSLATFLGCISAYLLGSVPYGLIIATKFCGTDPRTAGSGNVGATNVARLCGKGWGALTLLCDLGKGALAVSLALYMARYFDGWQYTHLAAGFFVIVGHMFPVFFHFKGGKGVATTVGVFLVLSPLPFIMAAIICLLVIWRSGFVSAGSLTLALCIPLFAAVMGQYAVAVLGGIVALMIIIAHRQNIRRLVKGEEKPWNTKQGKQSDNDTAIS